MVAVEVIRPKEIRAGVIVGWLTVRQRVNASRRAPPWRRKMWRVECRCGIRMTLPEFYLVRERPRVSCGCHMKTVKTTHNQEYRIWCMMRQRCYTSSHVAFKHYGGRGIKICDEWLGEAGFATFLKHIGPRPSPGHSVDRYPDVNGNYAPGNVRWATAKQQAANKR